MPLYASIEPYDTAHLPVSDGHLLRYEQVGSPNGKPALFLHGGPGGGAHPVHRRFWDPRAYRVILFDQRGAGRSTPHASLEANTTWHLVEDIETLRKKLEIERWQVFGGSWGSTLALAYAITHPEQVSELILRGIFLLRREEIDWFYRGGAARLFPDAWEQFLEPLEHEERADPVESYYRRLTEEDPTIRLPAARAWSRWEARTSRLSVDPELLFRNGSAHFAEAFARIECHYFVHEGFLERDGWLLEEIDRVRSIPTVIVHGRYDVVCPLKNAWDLHRAFPESELDIAPVAGHAATEPEIADRLVAATDRFRR